MMRKRKKKAKNKMIQKMKVKAKAFTKYFCNVITTATQNELMTVSQTKMKLTLGILKL